MGKEQTPDLGLQPEPITFAQFLERTPPSTNARISPLAESSSGGFINLLTPAIRLYCPACEGTRRFRLTDSDGTSLSRSSTSLVWLTYTCSDCQEREKLFALIVIMHLPELSGECYKLGELPNFGPPTPARLDKLLGEDKATFRKGRQCENQGLGIAAYAYYRRVVQSQKDQIIGGIITAAEKLQAPKEVITKFKEALAEPQFGRAVESVKGAMPRSLLINEHNDPLELLHAELSAGIHERTDKECLESATHVRTVLAWLADRLAEVTKDGGALNKSVAAMAKRKNKKGGQSHA